MFHLIATRTIPTTLKGLREIHNRILPVPQIIASNEDPQVCYDHAITNILSRSRHVNDLASCINGLMIHATADWTYWIVQDKA